MKQILLISFFLVMTFMGISQNWVPLFAGSSIRVDADNFQNNKEYMRLQNGSKININDWNTYLRDFILKFPVATADSILDGLTGCSYENDKVEKMIRFGPNIDASAGYDNKSYISFSGFIKDLKIIPFVKFNYTGGDWVYANRIKLVCDNETFEYDSLKFLTIGTQDFVSEFVLIPFNENMQELIPKIINSNETIIRFYGDPLYFDLDVTEKMKMEMKKVLKIIRALQ